MDSGDDPSQAPRPDWLADNLANWDERAPAHAASPDYAYASSAADPAYLSEVVTALLGEGLAITGLTEHTSVPWEALPGQMERRPDGEWVLAEHPERLPLTYTLQAVKPG